MQQSIFFDLKGEVAVVTGAHSHLGVICQQALLSAGAMVAAVDAPEIPLAPDSVALQSNYGSSRLKFYHADFADKLQLNDLRQRIEITQGVVSVLLNNTCGKHSTSGVDYYSLVDFPSCQYHDVFALNVDTILPITQVFAESMISHGYGSIINIGDLTDENGEKNPSPTHMDFASLENLQNNGTESRAAVVNFTKYLAAQWENNGVRVNALSASPILAYLKSVKDQEKCHSDESSYSHNIREILGTLLFFASRASSSLTGQEILFESDLSIA